MFRKISPFLFFLILLCSASAASEVKITGMYSNMRYDEQSGDLAGEEVFIIYAGRSGYYAVVQFAMGGPGPPLLVPVKVSGNVITFEIPKQHDYIYAYGKFKGVVSQAGITGEFEDANYKTFLPRKNSYWQR